MIKISGIALMTAVLAALLMAGPLAAQPMGVPKEARQEPTPGQWGKALVGGQLGPWFTSDLGNEITEPNARLDASNTAFHLEFFYQPHMTGILNLDFSIGAINRGDLRVRTGEEDIFGDATIYPLSAGIILYPMAKRTQQKLQPSLRAGGSLVVGTELFEINLARSNLIGFDTESRTALGYYFGAGANLVLSPSFCLTGTVKYQRAKFDKELFGVKDYSGTMVLIGAAYMYR
ncbi:MAG TPA: hypothetical protein VNN55_06530 [bacterium]|nr:hypothetical protein [bacterium]